MRQLLVFVGVVMVAGLLACDNVPTTDQKQAVKQEELHAEALRQVGMPAVTNFTEMKLVRKLYELRDQSIATFSYVQDMQGRLWHVCDSVGFGLPYGVQFTNPEAHYWNSQGNYNIPQPEPNGLFMPSSAEGTWIMCASVKNPGEVDPVYVEPRVIVSTSKLNAAGDYQLR